MEHLLGSSQFNFYWLFVETIPDSISNLTCLSYLGKCDANRIVSLCVTSPKVSKASKDTDAVEGGFAKNFTNIYTTLIKRFFISWIG